jgi:hypothetical protein
MLTQERLKELLQYNPDSGIFVRISGRAKGNITGAPHSEGYVRIKIEGKLYFSHRLAWLYVHGSFPHNVIDHINGIRDDNSISNLRDVTQNQNLMNQKLKSNNKSGLKGVSWVKDRRKWRAQIQHNSLVTCLGDFNNKKDAHAAYKKAADMHFGEFARY